MIQLNKVAKKLQHLVELHGTKQTGLRHSVARLVLEHMRSYCDAEGLDPIGRHSCPTCNFLDEALFCPNCGKPVMRSEMIIGSRPAGVQWDFEFIAYCPHCKKERPPK